MFYVKDKEKSVTAIEAIVSISGRKYKYATGLSVNPEFWISKSHRAEYSRKYPDGKKINENLENLERHLSDVIEFFRWRSLPTPSEFREKVKSKTDGSDNEKISLIDYIEKYYLSQNYQYETEKKYVTAIGKISKYEVYSNKQIFLQDVNIDFYQKFRSWFYSLINPKSDQSYSKNYFGSIIKVIKKVMNYASESGDFITLSHHHSQFIVENEEAETIYLTQDELMKIHHFQISEDEVQKLFPGIRAQNLKRKIKSMEVARARFLLGAFTALRVSDFNRLSDVDFSGKFLKITTKKTGKQVVIPIHPVVKYYFTTEFFNNKMSDQKINDRIKEVCQLAGINELVSITRTHGGKSIKSTIPKYSLVTTHSARRSAATNMYKAGIPAISIMKITGHKTEKSFMKYIKITEEENAELLSKHSFFTS